MNKYSLLRVFKASLFIAMSCVMGHAQDWQKIPVVPPGPREPNLMGVSTTTVVKTGSVSHEARVVVSGARQARIFTLGLWIRGLSDLMAEKELWPYMGPDLGKEAMNPKMVEIVVSKDGIKHRWNFPMIVISGGNFPKSDWDKKDLFFSVAIKCNSKDYSIFEKMRSGFDDAVIVVGRGVFLNPVEVRIVGKGFGDAFGDAVEFVNPGRPKPRG